jgi:hypothetical protein
VIAHDGVSDTLTALHKKFCGKPFNIPKSLGGEYQFGWGPETITDIGSRLNFAAIQAYFPFEKKRVDMLDEVLFTELGISSLEMSLVDFNDTENTGEFMAYIDHQSAASEGMNLEMFDSITNLISFIFSESSRIELDNDNR